MPEIFTHVQRILYGVKRGHVNVVELGANDGYHTALMADLLQKSSHLDDWSLFAFEPDHRVFSRLQDDTQQFHPNVHHILAAVGDCDGYLDFWFSGGHEKRPGKMQQHFSGSSSLLEPAGVKADFPDMTFRKGRVRCHQLDTWMDLQSAVNPIDTLDFIWADIQGAELKMITGARKTLLRTRYLYTEYSNGGLYAGDASLAQILANLPGWVVEEDFGGDVLLRNKLV